MTIRPACDADAPAVAALSGQLGYPSGVDEIAQRMACLAAHSDQAILVAEETGAVVAWVHIIGAERLVVAPFAEVGGLVVDAAWRGRGLGTALLAAAETWAAERGYELMRIRSNVIREDAHRFYEARGYEGSKRQVVFAKTLDVPSLPDRPTGATR
jgi:GNAT superfamily N-acetyltransferase